MKKIEEIEEQFNNKKYNSYLVGGLTGILGPESYEFMVKITKDYLGKPWRYKGWFLIEDFTYNFVKQERTDIIPLLEQVLAIKNLTGSEKEELQETIRAIQDPIGYEKEIEEIEEEILDATTTDT